MQPQLIPQISEFINTVVWLCRRTVEYRYCINCPMYIPWTVGIWRNTVEKDGRIWNNSTVLSFSKKYAKVSLEFRFRESYFEKKNQSEIVFVKVFANFREIRTSSAKVMGCTRQKHEIPMVGQPRTLTLKSWDRYLYKLWGGEKGWRRRNLDTHFDVTGNF